MICIYKDRGLKVMLVSKEESLTTVLEAMENVLRGIGYSFEGHLDIVEEEK